MRDFWGQLRSFWTGWSSVVACRLRAPDHVLPVADTSSDLMPRCQPNRINPETKSSIGREYAGLTEPRTELKEVVQFLHDPERFRSLGARLPARLPLHARPTPGEAVLAAVEVPRLTDTRRRAGAWIRAIRLVVAVACSAAAVGCGGPGAYPGPGPDVDCVGGAGDGPRYVGAVKVTGPDPYGLDRDGDGIGCE